MQPIKINPEINFFAKTNYRNRDRIFGIKTDDRRRHFYTLGKTGMGKTSMIQNMAIQDIRAGKGLAIIDPHGEFAEECLKAVPEERIEDVIYFNPADLDYPIALNVMEQVEPEYRHLVSSGLIGIFKKLWADSWGPRLEYILRNAILALLSHPQATLLGINRLLVDKQYREEVLSYVDDPVVSAFWIDEFSKYNDRMLTEAISPIQNKVGQFLSSALIRNIVGQFKTSFSVREIMDSRKIFIMNLSKGRIGEDNSALLGAMMVTKIQLAAMSRVDLPEEKRNDFYLYVDEFQNFATDSFAGILSEARKYRLNLILAHQFMAQLEEPVRDAVLGNVGTIVAFRVGSMDTEVLEKEFSPVFTASDLVNLDKYNIYLKLMVDGVATRPFSATTLPPIDISDTEHNSAAVIAASRRKYAKDRAAVEQQIMEWSGMKKKEVINSIKDLAKQSLNNNSTVNVEKDSDQREQMTQAGIEFSGAVQSKQSKIEQQSGTVLSEETKSAGNQDSGQGLDFVFQEAAFGIPQEEEDGVQPSVISSQQSVGNNLDNSHSGVQQDVSFSDQTSQAVEMANSKSRNRRENKSEKTRSSKSNKKQKNRTTQNNNSDNDVKEYPVTCSACGEETTVKFEPDGVRPVFCPECLKEYRRAQAKLQNQQ